MADVQLEHGFLRIANALDEAITYADFSATHMKIVRTIVRLTYGWQRLSVQISHRDLAERCGLRLGGGFRRALEELIANGVIRELQPGSGRVTAAYAINKDYERWGRFSVANAVLDRLFRERPINVDRMPKPVDGARGYVYYARDGNHVKIGYSSDPWTRVLDMRTARPTVELIAIEPGDRKVEAERHRQFAEWRIADNREWFEWSAEIERHIETIQPAVTNAPYAPDEADVVEWSDPTGTVSHSPQGHPATPRGGMPSSPKSDNGNELEAPKDSRKTVEKHATTTSARDEEVQRYAVGMATAANNAITEKWGAQPNVLHWSRACPLASELVARNVPLDLARVAIANCVRRSKNERPPASFNFFASAIDDEVRAQEQRALDRVHPAPAASVKPTRISAALQPPGTISLADKNDRERAWASARRAAGIAWGKDPNNAARYREFVEKATAEYRDFFEGGNPPNWVVNARDKRVIELCADAAGFPTLREWTPEKVGAG